MVAGPHRALLHNATPHGNCVTGTLATSSDRRSDVALETIERLLVGHQRPLLLREVLRTKNVLEELLVDVRPPLTGVLVLVALGDGGLETTGSVRHHDVPVRVVDGTRECDRIAITGEDAGGIDVVHPVDLGGDAEERISRPFFHPHDPRTMLPGEDDHVDPSTVFGLGAQLGEPEVVLGDDLALVEFTERTRPREESCTVEKVEIVVARACQDEALDLREAVDREGNHFQDCTCRIG